MKTWNSTISPFCRLGVASGILLSIASLQSYSLGSSNSLDTWQYCNPVPTANAITGVRFINGQFVAVGSGSTLLTSEDGTNWVTRPVPGNLALNDVAFGSNLYAAVGFYSTNSIVATSTNLNDWSCQFLPAKSAMNCIAYGNGIFTVVDANGAICTSTNGTDWSGITVADNFSEIVFGNGVFLAKGRLVAYISTNGTTWTVPTTTNFVHITFSKGMFHASGWHKESAPPYDFPINDVYYSRDGSSWGRTRLSLPYPSYAPIIFDTESAFFIGVGMGYYGQSVDGTNYSSVPMANTPTGSKFANGNGVVVSAGATLEYSTTGTNWTTATHGAQRFLYLSDIAYGNGVYAAVGSSGNILTSFDGHFFRQKTLPSGSSLSKILFTNGLFHCVGYGGTLLRSTNGMEWFARNPGSSTTLLSICYGNGQWVAVGENGVISTSPNGQAWTLRTSGTSFPLRGIVHGPSLFVAVGDFGTILTSPDGITWTVQFSDSVNALYGVTYGNGKYVAVGVGGTVLISTDGTSWIGGSSGITSDIAAVEFAGRTFLAGSGAMMISSTNATNWSSVNFTAAPNIGGIRFINNAFWCVGDNGMILQNPSQNTLQLGGKWNASAMQIIVNGGLGQSFRIESCDSLLHSSWTDRGGVTNAPNPVLIADPSSIGQPRRFYRAVSQ